MFARIVEFIPKLEKKEELVKVLRNEVLPILKKQTGFMEILPFFPETKNEKVITVTLWTEKRYAERYEREAFPKVEEVLQKYMITKQNPTPKEASEMLRLLDREENSNG